MTGAPDHQDVADAILAWWAAGCAVLPAARDGSKMPAVEWKRYQTEPPSQEQIETWISAGFDGYGMVCGAASGNVEMLELEGRAADLLQSFLAAVAAEDQSIIPLLATYMERTPSGGYHFLYRVEGEEVGGNQKLARRPKEPTPESPANHEVLIETRGRAGWTIMAPSGGRTHPSGQPWIILTGQPGVLATLTEEQHEIVLEVARSFDQMPLPAPVEHRPATTSASGELAPGQDFESRADWMADLLGPLGWTIWKRQGDKLILSRPGKRFGASATINYDGNNNLYVFTSSTDFPEFSSWTKFGAYAFLHHGGDYAAAARDLRARGYGTPSEPTRILRLVQGGAGGSGGPGGAPPPTDGSTALQPGPASIPVSLTDDGNGLLLTASAKDRLLYVPERKQWMGWDGIRWEPQPDDAQPMQMFREVVRSMRPTDEAEAKHKIKSLGFKSAEYAVKYAMRDPAIRISTELLDADPMVLNTPSGILNLLTCELAAPDPAGHHTRVTGVPVDFDMPCPRWLRFLHETFLGDETLIGYIQRLAGYSATGRVTHHVLPFCFGSGGNGKTQFFEVMQSVLGDYAGTAPADFLLAGGKDESSAVAELSGQRFVVCSEVGPTAHFNEQKVKNLTGGERLTARFLYQRQFTFSPTHHLWLVGNHQPRVEAGGDSFWRRLRLLPFTNTVPEEKQIDGLAELLVAEEGPAILAWIAAGARMQLEGLNEPDAVKAATAGYAEEEDHIGRFLGERIRRGGDPKLVRLNTKIVRHAYEAWCAAEGIPSLPAQTFGRELKARGIEAKQSNGQRFYVSLSLQHSDDDDDDRPHQTRF